jgi:hypothetical protein
MKNSTDTIGNRTRDLPVCSNCLNQLRHRSPLLPVSGRLMAVLLLYMFSPTVGNSKCSYALSEMLHCYDLENPATFGVSKRILRVAWTGILNTHKTGTVLGKAG